MCAAHWQTCSGSLWNVWPVLCSLVHQHLLWGIKGTLHGLTQTFIVVFSLRWQHLEHFHCRPPETHPQLCGLVPLRPAIPSSYGLEYLKIITPLHRTAIIKFWFLHPRMWCQGSSVALCVVIASCRRSFDTAPVTMYKLAALIPHMSS